MQPKSAWLPLGAGEAGMRDFSSDSEAASEPPSPATRTVSQVLRPACMP